MCDDTRRRAIHNGDKSATAPSSLIAVLLHCSEHRQTKHRPRRTTSLIFTARRCASAVFALVVCPTVRLFVTSRYCIEKTGRTELGIGMGSSFHLSDTVLIGNMAWVRPKLRVLPSGALSQTPYLKNFATASRSRC